jgi:ribosomal protein S18 acetylase RimI-like enzyme
VIIGKGDMGLGTVVKAHLTDMDDVAKIDKEVIGNDKRRDYIQTSISEERCLLVREEGSIAGFLIYDSHFFGCSFISLVIISPTARRKGYASKLLNYFVSISPTEKIFSSTNRSNESMQKVFMANGFRQSGLIENLDERDPEIIYFKSK